MGNRSQISFYHMETLFIPISTKLKENKCKVAKSRESVFNISESFQHFRSFSTYFKFCTITSQGGLPQLSHVDNQFTLPPETTQKLENTDKSVAFKTLFNRQQMTLISERWVTTRWATGLPGAGFQVLLQTELWGQKQWSP